MYADGIYIYIYIYIYIIYIYIYIYISFVSDSSRYTHVVEALQEQ